MVRVGGAGGGGLQLIFVLCLEYQKIYMAYLGGGGLKDCGKAI